MSIFSTNRFKCLSAEYVEESLRIPNKADVQKFTTGHVEKKEEDVVDESAYLDSLLESLNEEE